MASVVPFETRFERELEVVVDQKLGFKQQRRQAEIRIPAVPRRQAQPSALQVELRCHLIGQNGQDTNSIQIPIANNSNTF